MKLWISVFWCDDCPVLKSKEPRLRDWNSSSGGVSGSDGVCLKSKEPRLRDWNLYEGPTHGMAQTHQTTWNQKNLDYEIETYMKSGGCARWNSLEIKRTSITRLKPIGITLRPPRNLFSLKSKEPRLRDWNLQSPVLRVCLMYPWNQKNLDYGIET